MSNTLPMQGGGKLIQLDLSGSQNLPRDETSLHRERYQDVKISAEVKLIYNFTHCMSKMIQLTSGYI